MEQYVKNILRKSAVIGLISAFSMPALAQKSEPEIRLVVPFAAGGSATTSARIFADHLAKVLDTKVYVDNKGGASGAIGASIVARSPSDGATLLYSSAGMMTVNPTLFGEQLTYSVDQFVPISMTSTFASVLFAGKDVPADDVQGLVAYAKDNPGAVTFGSAGAGSSGHLWGEVLKSRAEIDIRHVPYKGTAPALIDVVGGRISFVMDAVAAGQGLLQGGGLKALAVTSANRVPSLPDTPTFAEAGLEGFEILNWYGVFAPAGTPQERIDTLSAAISKVASLPEYQDQLTSLGMSAASINTTEYKSLIEEDSQAWASVIKNAGITLQ